MRLTPRLAIYLTLPPLMWAGNAVLGRSLASSVSPGLLNGLRWTLALCLLLPLARTLWAAPALLRRHWRYYAVLGLLGMGCYNALQYQALHTSSALNVTLIASSMPVWMLLVGMLMYGVRPRGRELIGALLSLVGVALVIGRGSWATLMAVHFVAGDLLMLLAVFLWAIYSWLLVRPPFAEKPPWDWAGALVAQMLFGVVFAGLLGGAEAAVGLTVLEWRPSLLLALAYLAIGPSLIAYRCWGLGVAEAGPAMAAFFFNLTPALTALLSASLLGEWPAWYHGAAFGLIVAGIVVARR
ncbi:MAG TPA: DMT family transporter [Burkholderiaceae bacterium]